MNEMIERGMVAFLDGQYTADDREQIFSGDAACVIDNLPQAMRRAIAAMREPTKAMSQAAYEAAGCPSDRYGLEDMWRAAIDEALK